MFNNEIIFVLLFEKKTPKLLLSLMTVLWVEETKESLIILVTTFSLRKDMQNVVLDHYGMSFIINTGI